MELSWDAPEQCPSRESVLERISIALGDSRSAEKVNARARIRRDPSGAFVLSLGIRSGKLDNTRTITDPSCDVLADAAVVMLVLAMDPARALRTDAVAPSGKREPEERDIARSAPMPPMPKEPAPEAKRASTVQQPASTPASRLTEARERRLALGIGLAPTADFGTFGRPSMGSVASVHASFLEKFRVEVGFSAWMPVNLPLANSPIYGIRIGAVGLAARGCFLPITRGAMQLGACAGLDLMAAHASAFGTRESRSDEAMWAAVGAGLLGRQRLSRTLHFVGSVHGVLPLEGPQYGVVIGDAAQRVHRVSFAVRVTLGIELALF